MQTADIEGTKVVVIGNTEKTITSSMTHKMYGWSKYGGANYGLVQEDKTPEWSCQACGERQGSEMPSYMFEFSKDEFIRICTTCQRLKLEQHIKSMDELIKSVRNHREPWDELLSLANLLTPTD